MRAAGGLPTPLRTCAPAGLSSPLLTCAAAGIRLPLRTSPPLASGSCSGSHHRQPSPNRVRRRVLLLASPCPATRAAAGLPTPLRMFAPASLSSLLLTCAAAGIRLPRRTAPPPAFPKSCSPPCPALAARRRPVPNQDAAAAIGTSGQRPRSTPCCAPSVAATTGRHLCPLHAGLSELRRRKHCVSTTRADPRATLRGEYGIR
ncbi:hypothetical protein BS78_03G134000 [Paspalum vaginatum]|nr:hypothetical protein BS78_03G134000 [Paspalum vaginatum]